MAPETRGCHDGRTGCRAAQRGLTLAVAVAERFKAIVDIVLAMINSGLGKALACRTGSRGLLLHHRVIGWMRPWLAGCTSALGTMARYMLLLDRALERQHAGTLVTDSLVMTATASLPMKVRHGIVVPLACIVIGARWQAAPSMYQCRLLTLGSACPKGHLSFFGTSNKTSVTLNLIASAYLLFCTASLLANRSLRWDPTAPATATEPRLRAGHASKQ